MIEALDQMYFKWKYKAEAFFQELKEDESGVSAFVATILLILIVVLLCALFWDKISTWFNETWDKITGKAGGIA